MVDSITLAMIDTNIEYINDSYDLDLRVKTIHNGYRLVAKNQSHEIAFGSKEILIIILMPSSELLN